MWYSSKSGNGKAERPSKVEKYFISVNPGEHIAECMLETSTEIIKKGC